MAPLESVLNTCRSVLVYIVYQVRCPRGPYDKILINTERHVALILKM